MGYIKRKIHSTSINLQYVQGTISLIATSTKNKNRHTFLMTGSSEAETV